MPINYSNSIKKTIATKICIDRESTLQTANEYNIPLKTVEKWVTSFNKNPKCFDEFNPPTEVKYTEVVSHVIYDDLTEDELKNKPLKQIVAAC